MWNERESCGTREMCGQQVAGGEVFFNARRHKSDHAELGINAEVAALHDVARNANREPTRVAVHRIPLAQDEGVTDLIVPVVAAHLEGLCSSANGDKESGP